MSIRQPKYRRHSSSNNALVCINGQRHYLGRFGSPESKERYRRLVAQYWAGQPIESPRRSKASPCDPDGVTIAEVCAAYAKHAAAYYRKDGAPTKDRTRNNFPECFGMLFGGDRRGWGQAGGSWRALR